MEDDKDINWVFWKPQPIDPALVKDVIYNIAPLPLKVVMDPNRVANDTKENAKEILRKTPIYKWGKYEGKKEGATETAIQFEERFNILTKNFEDKEFILKKDIMELKALIQDYEDYIQEREAEFEHLSKEQQAELEEVKRKNQFLRSKLRDIESKE